MLQTKPLPVQNLIQGFIGVLVAFNPLHEVLNCFICVAVSVIWAAQLHLLLIMNTRVNGNSLLSPVGMRNMQSLVKPSYHNILGNDCRVFTNRLHKKYLA